MPSAQRTSFAASAIASATAFSRPTRGRARSAGTAKPRAKPKRRRVPDGDRASAGKELLQLAALVHLQGDVAAPDQLAIDVQLRIGRPVGIALQRFPQLRFLEDVHVLEFGSHGAQRRDRLRGKAALRKSGVPFMNSTTGLEPSSALIFSTTSIDNLFTAYGRTATGSTRPRPYSGAKRAGKTSFTTQAFLPGAAASARRPPATARRRSWMSSGRSRRRFAGTPRNTPAHRASRPWCKGSGDGPTPPVPVVRTSGRIMRPGRQCSNPAHASLQPMPSTAPAAAPDLTPPADLPEQGAARPAEESAPATSRHSSSLRTSG